MNSKIVTDVLIIGFSLAAISHLHALAAKDFQGRVVVIGAEAEMPYDRPPLSKQVLSTSSPASLSEDFSIIFPADRLTIITGFQVTHLKQTADSADKTSLEDANNNQFYAKAERVTESVDSPEEIEVTASAIILATGATPRTLPSFLSGEAGPHLLRTFSQQQAIKDSVLSSSSPVNIVGGGWLGLELASAFASSGRSVRIFERESQLLAGTLPAGQVAILTPLAHLPGKVSAHTDVTIAEVGRNHLVLANGKLFNGVTIAVVGAVGNGEIAPLLSSQNVELLNGQLLVDDQHRVLAASTGKPLAGVWAVGDASFRRSPRFGIVLAGHWNYAVDSANQVAASICNYFKQTGDEVAHFDPAPYVFSTIAGKQLAIFGEPKFATSWGWRGENTLLFFADSSAKPILDSEEVASDESNPTKSESSAGHQKVTLVAALIIDAPREVSAIRRAFSGTDLPVFKRETALDSSQKLKPVPAS